MTRTLVRFALFVFALTLTTAAFAGNNKLQYVSVAHDVQLNGKTLPAGDYYVKYDTSGSTAQVTFLKNGKEVASANGQLKQLDSTPEYNQIVTQDGNGTKTLSEIDFAKTKTGVTFEASALSGAGSQ